MKNNKYFLMLIVIFGLSLVFIFMKTNSPKYDEVVVNLTDGLKIDSEIHSTVQPFFVESSKVSRNLSADEFLRLISKPSETPIERKSATAALASFSEQETWFDEEEKVRAARFKKIKEYFEANLTSLSLFEIGKIEKEIFIFGNDKKGNIVGIRYFVVET